MTTTHGESVRLSGQGVWDGERFRPPPVPTTAEEAAMFRPTTEEAPRG